jgi:hypothetical protein
VVTTRRRKIPKIVATFVYASRQGHHMHSAGTKIPKIGQAKQNEKVATICHKAINIRIFLDNCRNTLNVKMIFFSSDVLDSA